MDSQILKGILEGCILQLIEREELYGYKTVERLNEMGIAVNEATVYPILARLEQKGDLAVDRRPSPLGPLRKYYHLTASGQHSLLDFMAAWQEISRVVEHILEEGPHD